MGKRMQALQAKMAAATDEELLDILRVAASFAATSISNIEIQMTGNPSPEDMAKLELHRQEIATAQCRSGAISLAFVLDEIEERALADEAHCNTLVQAVSIMAATAQGITTGGMAKMAKEHMAQRNHPKKSENFSIDLTQLHKFMEN